MKLTNKEELIILFGLAVLMMVINSDAIQYLGDKQLCIIDSHNVKTCIENGESYNMTSNIIVNLYDVSYTLSVNSYVDFFNWLLYGIILIVVLFVVIKIIQYL